MGWGSKEDDRLEVGRRAAAHLEAQQQAEFRKKVAQEASEARRARRAQELRDEAEEKLAKKLAKEAKDRRTREERRQQKAAIRARAGTPARAKVPLKVPGKRPDKKGFFS